MRSVKSAMARTNCTMAGRCHDCATEDLCLRCLGKGQAPASYLSGAQGCAAELSEGSQGSQLTSRQRPSRPDLAINLSHSHANHTPGSIRCCFG